MCVCCAVKKKNVRNSLRNVVSSYECVCLNESRVNELCVGSLKSISKLIRNITVNSLSVNLLLLFEDVSLVEFMYVVFIACQVELS